jgi:hypothetical protein
MLTSGGEGHATDNARLMRMVEERLAKCAAFGFGQRRYS